MRSHVIFCRRDEGDDEFAVWMRAHATARDATMATEARVTPHPFGVCAVWLEFPVMLPIRAVTRPSRLSRWLAGIVAAALLAGCTHRRPDVRLHCWAHNVRQVELCASLSGQGEPLVIDLGAGTFALRKPLELRSDTELNGHNHSVIEGPPDDFTISVTAAAAPVPINPTPNGKPKK